MACPSIYPFVHLPTFVLSGSQGSWCPPPVVWEAGNTLVGVETSSFTQSNKKDQLFRHGVESWQWRWSCLRVEEQNTKSWNTVRVFLLSTPEPPSCCFWTCEHKRRRSALCRCPMSGSASARWFVQIKWLLSPPINKEIKTASVASPRVQTIKTFLRQNPPFLFGLCSVDHYVDPYSSWDKQPQQYLSSTCSRHPPSHFTLNYRPEHSGLKKKTYLC